MATRDLTRTDPYVIGWAAAISIAALVWGGTPVILGALAGGALAVVNWIGFRWAGVRMAATGNRGRFFVFLAVKMSVVLAAVSLLVLSGSVSPLALMLGLSALVLGILTRSGVRALAEGEAALREHE